MTKSKERREVLRAIFFRPFRLSLAPTICPWVSEDAFYLYIYIYIWNQVISVSFSDGGLGDRDTIFRDETDLVFCFLGCVVTFPAREANNWWRRATSNPGNWVCVFFSFFPPSYRFSVLTIKRTLSLKQGRCENTRKGRKETESNWLHSTSELQITVWLGVFVL